MSKLKKLWNDFIGKSETEETVVHDNSVDAKKELRNAIIAYFRKNFLTEIEVTGTFIVWVNDSQAKYQDYVRKEDFTNELYTELDNRQLNVINKAKIEFKTENPLQEFEKIMEGVYIQFLVRDEETQTVQEVCSKARITIVKGKGSLMETKYLLEAEKQTEYNIGRGTNNNNHIVINENDPANSEVNNRVSRQHAKIVFITGKGFYLQSRNETNRTFINRNNQRFDDLTDLNKKTLLQNNDEIELGKSVCLKFEMIADSAEI
jgi:hypothetical protein